MNSISWPHLPRDDFLIDLDRLVSEEGRVTSSHLVDEDPESPPVHSFVVALEQDGGGRSMRQEGEEGDDSSGAGRANEVE